MNITFDLVVQEKFFAITLSPSRDSVNVLTYLRKDIWKKSEVQNIINLVEISVSSTNDYLVEFMRPRLRERKDTQMQ